MTYKINGTTLTLQPTRGRWVPQRSLGTRGDNREIYPPTHEFELSWQLQSTTDFDQIYDDWAALASSGSNVVDLPNLNSATYTFYSFTGCIVDQPEVGPYYNQHYTDVKMLIKNIRVP